MLKQLLTGVAFAAAAIGANAQHAHSDIDAVIESGAFEIENGILLTSGSVVFEAEFGSLAGANLTDDPGFVVDDGSFLAGEFLAYEAVGSLQYWDGSSWGSSAEIFTIIDNSATTSDTTITGAGVSNGLGFIDAADAGGGVHTHITNFQIDLAAASGAYMIELVLRGFSDSGLSNEIYTASDSFFLAFNYGLGEEDFEAGIDALGVAAVPVPAAGLLMASALGMLGVYRRTRK